MNWRWMLQLPRRLLSAVCLLAVIAGCSDVPPDVGLRVKQVLQSDYCAQAAPGVALITDESQWLTLQPANDRFVGTPDTRSGQSSFAQLAEDSLLILVAAGQQPSAGYHLAVDTYAWEREQDELVLSVELDSPPGDSMQATVITSPCVVIAVRNYADIARIRFVGLEKEWSIALPVAGQP
jgi:hypothetical protein